MSENHLFWKGDRKNAVLWIKEEEKGANTNKDIVIIPNNPFPKIDFLRRRDLRRLNYRSLKDFEWALVAV